MKGLLIIRVGADFFLGITESFGIEVAKPIKVARP